jgi:hypothetical protein
MPRRLPYADWIAAQRELQAIRQRARMVGEPDLEKILSGIYRTLVAERLPLVAACELEFVAELVSRYPHLQASLVSVAKRIYAYPMAESSLSSHFRW